MILAIDTGNTHIVLGCIDPKGAISHIIRLETNLGKTEYEYASEIKQILELEGVDRFAFDGAIISSSVSWTTRARSPPTSSRRQWRPKTSTRFPVSSLIWGRRRL